MNRIIAGKDETLDYTLVNANGGPFEMAGSTVVFTATTPGGTTALTQTLVVDIFGTATTSDGLALGSGGSSSGEIVQTLTGAQTAALPTGILTWLVTLTDSTGKVDYPLRGQWRVVGAVYLDPTVTRAELRRSVADRLGDLVQLEATSASLSNTTFVDALNISGAADNLTGRQFIVVTGANAGHIARIVSSTESTNTITFTPAADNAFAAGDQLDVVNERSRGWSIAEYNRAINRAIRDAYPLGMAALAATISTDFDLDAPTITVPEVLDEVYEVSWQDPNTSVWYPVRGGQFFGWAVDSTAGTISIDGTPGTLAAGAAVRLAGYGRHPELLTDDDVTGLNPEWLTARACYHLATSGADRDGARANTILLFQRDSEGFRSRIRTMRKPGTVRVRQ